MDPREDGAVASAGARVRRARVARGVSLRTLARRIEVSPATLSQIENGKTGLTVERLDRIAEALEVSSSDILEARPVSPTARSTDGSVTSPPSDSDRSPHSDETLSQWRTYGPLELPPVLKAALEEILEVGYHGTSMREISKRCGLSVPGIYNYFKSKQEILMTIHQVTMDDLARRTSAALAEGAGQDPVAKFCLLIENMALYHTHRRELGFIGATELRALTPQNREIIVAKRNRQQALVDEQVLAAVRTGAFDVQNPEDASRAVVTLCTALPTWWRPGGRMRAEEIAQLYVGYALDLMRFEHRTPQRGAPHP